MLKLACLCLAASFIAGPVLAADTSAFTKVHATSEQLQNIQGVYRLSNGRVFKLLLLDDRLYVELKRGRKELVAIAENVYATKDGAIKVTYNPDAPPGDSWISVEGDRDVLERVLPEHVYHPLQALR
jgi:hypothetical protein